MSNFCSIASKRLALSLVSVSIFALSTDANAFSQGITLQEQVIDINVKYDKYTNTFHELSAKGTQVAEIELRSNGEFYLKHSRDGWLGKNTIINKTMSVSINRDDVGNHRLTNPQANTTFTYQAGLIGSNMNVAFNNWASGSHTGSNCTIDVPDTHLGGKIQNVNAKIKNIYSAASCRTRQYYTVNYTYQNIDSIGYIERMFKINMSEIKKVKLGTYKHTLRSAAVSNTDNGIGYTRIPEYYRYNITVDVKPGIHTVILENKDLAFNVTKYGTTVEGAAQTGYGIYGSFDKGQEFTMTFTSANAASCGGNLCLVKNKSSEPIPYTALILDPYTLVNRKITASGGKATVYAGEEFGVSGVIRFEFIKDHAGLSGTYKDTVTVLTEIKL